MATIPVFYVAGFEGGGRRAGAIAAALAAISPGLVWYSQEARSYALLVLTCAGSLLYVLRVVRDARGRPPPVAMWALVSALALASHYFAVFVVAPEALWLLLAGPRRRGVLIACGAVGLAGASLLPLAVRQHGSGGTDWIDKIPLGDRLLDIPPQLLLGEGRPLYHFFALGLGLVMVAPLAFVVLAGGHQRRRAVLLACRRSSTPPACTS